MFFFGFVIEVYIYSYIYRLKLYDEYKYNNFLNFYYWMEINVSFVFDVVIRFYNEILDKIYFLIKYF